MNCKLLTSIIFSSLLLTSTFASEITVSGMPQDSIGAEKKGNKWLVLHKVESGESLSSLSRKYKATVNAIKSENPAIADGLKLGEVVKIPYTPAVTHASSGTANGKRHTVAAGQGLFAIARMYNVPIADLRKWNNLESDNIREGQELIVSGDKKSAHSSAVTDSHLENNMAVTSNAGKKTHIVKSGEGMLGIARKYHISVDNLKKWNGLHSNTLQLGQELVVAEPSRTEPDRASTQVASTETPKPPVKEAVAPAKAETGRSIEPAIVEKRTVVETKPLDTTTITTTTVNNKPVVEAPRETPRKEARLPESTSDYTIANTSGYVKTVETGMAEVIGETDENDMFLALHRTAPVGTIMQVRNQMNDLSVFVKVIGKLPDTGANDRVIVKISKKAYERLAAVDRKFRVEVSYMPN